MATNLTVIFTTIKKDDVVAYVGAIGLQNQSEAAGIALASAVRLQELEASALRRTDTEIREAARDGRLPHTSYEGGVTITCAGRPCSSQIGGGGRQPSSSSHAESSDVENIFTEIQSRALDAAPKQEDRPGPHQYAGMRIYISDGPFDIGFCSFREGNPTEPEHTETFLLRKLLKEQHDLLNQSQQSRGSHRLYLYSTFSPCYGSEGKCLDQLVNFAKNHRHIQVHVAFNSYYFTSLDAFLEYLRIDWPCNLQVYHVSVPGGKIDRSSLQELPRGEPTAQLRSGLPEVRSSHGTMRGSSFGEVTSRLPMRGGGERIEDRGQNEDRTRDTDLQEDSQQDRSRFWFIAGGFGVAAVVGFLVNKILRR